jgi:anthraniloyl-CoA monooxygenase
VRNVRIVCVGGGPAGLYFAILAKLSGSHDVTVIERNGPDATDGWSVTFAESFLDDLYRNDPVSARAIRRGSLLWREQVVLVGDRRPVHIGGKYGYSISRTLMLQILGARATELGVQIRFGSEINDPSEIDADLVVAADGVGSRMRTRFADHFGTTIETGHNHYIWLGTSKSFAAFTFAFQRTPAGLIWFYGYPSSEKVSTCIVECAPQTWTCLGLDRLGPTAGLHVMQDVFADALHGHRLLEPSGGLGTAPWSHFRGIDNRTWRRHNLVLMGDAAHTTHFGIGAGTVLAVEDAVALAETLRSADDLPVALSAYDVRRRAALMPVQEMARRSMKWFETIDTGSVDDPVSFAYSLLDRRGDQAAWQYRLHLATQIDGVRRVRRRLTSARRFMRAVRRPGAFGQRQHDRR